MKYHTDTIAACATAPGRGGVGVIRISGPKSFEIVKKIIHPTVEYLTPRKTHFFHFLDNSQQSIDHGLVIYFPAPHSFTGEDVVELQGHGSPVVMDMLLKHLIHHGARLAEPGEFSQRAFLNDKLDLAQAEAIADLIESGSESAARSAMRSLQGIFSKKINELVEDLIHLRVYIEAAIDFPEEEIDYLSHESVQAQYQTILEKLKYCLQQAQQGVVLKEGLQVVIAGKPNAGKSSLLNALAGQDRAIVTSIAGTTRDVLREMIVIDGLPIHIIDTAGLRRSDDEVEQEGIRRAWQEIEKADQILLVVDISENTEEDVLKLWPFPEKLPNMKKITLVQNKIDLVHQSPGVDDKKIRLSANTGQGVDFLKAHLKKIVNYQPNESQFTARRRHVQALEKSLDILLQSKKNLDNKQGELFAEDLRLIQENLNLITGKFTSDDLLGEIFSSFCIGK